MKIIYKDYLSYKLENQIQYIAKDKPHAAKRFRKKILERIKEIPRHSFSYRKSIFFDDEEIRDLIVDGYIIVFRIKEDLIEIFGFNKYEESY